VFESLGNEAWPVSDGTREVPTVDVIEGAGEDPGGLDVVDFK